MKIEQIEQGAFSANCYILINEAREALVIDPGAEAERIIQSLQDLHVQVVGYPLTHGHIDHVGALRDVYDAFPAPVALHQADARWAFTEQNGYPPYYQPLVNPPDISMTYQDGRMITFGNFSFRIMETPGHSPGGVLFLFDPENVMISGDTLFRGSIGRVDLPGSSPQDMMKSLQRIKTLEQNYTVYPGHGPSTTLDQEKAGNPYFTLNLA